MEKQYLISSPKKNITIDIETSVHPKFLNNDFEEQLLQSLKEKYLGICYSNYGLICNFYPETLKYDPYGELINENLDGTILIKLKINVDVINCYISQIFACKLTHTQKSYTRGINSSIDIFIRSLSDNFKYDNQSGKLIYLKNEKMEIEYVLVQIIDSMFHSNSDKISALGMLIDIASEEDIKNTFIDRV